jgi:hypothetical protein
MKHIPLSKIDRINNCSGIHEHSSNILNSLDQPITYVIRNHKIMTKNISII